MTTDLKTNYGPETSTSDVEKTRFLKGIENSLSREEGPWA